MKTTLRCNAIAGFFLAGLALGLPIAQAASFDCTKAQSPVEKMVCADPALSQLDEELSTTFRRAVANDPQIRQQQQAWLRDTREKCGTVECLTTAYRSQIQTLIGQPSAAAPAPNAVSPTPAAPVENNPLAQMIDARDFVGRSEPFQEYFWSEPTRKPFGKATTEWTDQDFQVLEQKLRERIATERNTAAERYRQSGQRTNPDDDSIYQNYKQALDEAIASIPKFKSWVGLAREKVQAAETQRVQAEQKRQADELQRQQEEAQRQVEFQQLQEKRNQQQNLWILAAIAALVIGGWCWNKFVRNRCPSCKSTSYDTISREETDRWRGTKQVTEKHSRGKNTRHVQTTYVTMHYVFCCKACRHEWSKDRKEEHGENSLYDRFLSGF